MVLVLGVSGGCGEGGGGEGVGRSGHTVPSGLEYQHGEYEDEPHDDGDDGEYRQKATRRNILVMPALMCLFDRPTAESSSHSRKSERTG